MPLRSVTYAGTAYVCSGMVDGRLRVRPLECPRGSGQPPVRNSKVPLTHSQSRAGGKLFAGALTVDQWRDEFGQWAIEPCELHRVYPALTEDTGTGNGTGERAVTGGETAVAEDNARDAL